METIVVDGGIPRIAFDMDRNAQPSEPEDYILGINGKILLVQEDDQEIQAGTMQLSYVPLSTVHEEEWSAFDVLDSLSDTAQYLELIDEHGDWSEVVREQFVDLIDCNLLILNRMKLDPKYRGKGLGLLAARTAIDCFHHGCGLVALKPFPLQFTSYQVAAGFPFTGRNDKRACLSVGPQEA